MRTRRLRLLAATAVAATVLGVTGALPARAYGGSALPCVQPNDRVSAITLSGGVAYLGGRFTAVRDRDGTTQARGHLAAVDLATCALTSWRADTDGEVTALTVSSEVVYVGGSFGSVAGVPRGRLAGVAVTGAVTGFDGRLDGPVLALATRSGVLYAGGGFLTAAGVTRTRLAAWTVPSGALLGGWAPKASAAVRSVATDATRVYVAGDFTKVGGLTSATHLAALDPATGAVQSSFAPRPGFPVDQVVVDATSVWVAGAGGGGRLATYRLDGSSPHAPWLTDGDVQTLVLAGSSVVAGGHFANVCLGGRMSGTACVDPLPRKKAFAVDRASGAVTSWSPKPNSALGLFSSAYDAATGRLYVGGDFTTVDGAAVAHLAVL